MHRLLILTTALLSTATAATVRISCLGDSITAGACSQQTHGYPAVLQSLLGTTGYTVTNYGNSGKTMLTQGLCGPPASGNCSYVGTPTWPQALGSSPDIATILFGTNDAKEFNWFGVQDNQDDSYVLDYIRMIRALKALPSRPKVVVMTLVPLYTPYPYDMNATVINDIVASPGGLLQQLAALEADSVIDLHSAFVNAGYGPNITCDGCHPIDAGYEFMAKVIASAIKAMVGDDTPLMAVDYSSHEFEAVSAVVNAPAVPGVPGIDFPKEYAPKSTAAAFA